MKKIDKNQKKLVDELQNLISNWSRIQNELYIDLC